MNEQPYVLKTNDAVLKPVGKNPARVALQIFVWVVVALLVLGSLIFGENLFMELNTAARVLLVAVVLPFGFYRGKYEYTPSPMELQFYEDRLVMYHPERYYSKRITRKQYNIMPYATVTKVVRDGDMIKIYGDGQSIWYNYRKDGTLPDEPTETRDVTKGMTYFCTALAPEVDFREEIETHSPLTVINE